MAKAMELLGEVATTGINPNIAKRTNNKAMITLSEAIDAYVKNRGHRLKPLHRKTVPQHITELFRDWMAHTLASISRERVEQRHKATDGAVWFGADKTTLRGWGWQEARHRPIYGRVRYVLCVGLRMIITVMMRVILFTGSADSAIEHQAPVARTVRKTERIRLHDFPAGLLL